MKLRLGVDGYAFATIDPVPQANDETKEISLTFVVDPKNRVYVRRVNFNGTSGVNDEVFRREMRQLEGAYLSNTAVERSKQRIQRLPFIEKVEVETNQVPGAADLVDVDFEIEEGLPGQFGGGVGYSESQSVILNGNFVHSNFMGTGNRIAAEINSGRYAKAFSFSHTDPLHDDRRSAALDLARLSRRHAVHLGDVGLRHRDDHASASTTTSRSPSTSTSASASRRSAPSWSPPRAAAPTQAIDWVRNNGNPRITCRQCDARRRTATTRSSSRSSAASSTPTSSTSAGATTRATARSSPIAARVTASTSATRCRAATSSSGPRRTTTCSSSRSGASFTLMFNVELAYGKALGDTTALPPYRQYFAGGPESVRGFRESRLGPKDNFGRPYGGNIKTVAQTELLLPMPEKWRNSARFSLFFDIGNVFSDQDIVFLGPDLDGDPNTIPAEVDYGFSYDELKQSVGVAVQWLAPLGVFRFSYAMPLNDKRGDTATRCGDETEGFQFSIGQAF